MRLMHGSDKQAREWVATSQKSDKNKQGVQHNIPRSVAARQEMLPLLLLLLLPETVHQAKHTC